MGSFKIACGITGLPIHGGDKVLIALLSRGAAYKRNKGAVNPTDGWYPFTPLMHGGGYNDCGYVEDVERTPIADFLLAYFQSKFEGMETPFGESVESISDLFGWIANEREPIHIEGTGIEHVDMWICLESAFDDLVRANYNPYHNIWVADPSPAMRELHVAIDLSDDPEMYRWNREADEKYRDFLSCQSLSHQFGLKRVFFDMLYNTTSENRLNLMQRIVELDWLFHWMSDHGRHYHPNMYYDQTDDYLYYKHYLKLAEFMQNKIAERNKEQDE